MNSTAIDQIRQGAQASELQSHTCIGKPRGVMLEAEMPEHCAQRFVAHANLSMISRYLKTTRTGMHEVLRRVEEHRIRCTHVAHGGSLAIASLGGLTKRGVEEAAIAQVLPGTHPAK